MNDSRQAVTPDRIGQMAFGFAAPLIVEAAVRNGVFDALAPRPKTVEELSAETGASLRGLRALLDALVGLELLAKANDRYRLTPESDAYLVSSKPDFQGGMFRHISRQLLPHWLDLAEVVRSGRPDTAVNREDQGAEFFRDFVEDLFPRGYPAARALAEHLKIAEAVQPVRVLDIAAGSGVWSVALAESNRRVEVTAVDWPAVIPVTKRIAERRGLAAQFRFLAGDILDADYGGGYHVATLGHILHSEGEKRSRALLKKVFAALEPGGTIAIAEMIPNEERTGPAHALIFAVNMLVHTETGDVFSFGEMSAWLREAGFGDAYQLEVPAPSPLVLARKPA